MVTKKNGVGYSETTLQKQKDFISIFTMLCNIWKGTTSRPSANDHIYYFDLNAGPGIDLNNPIVGSPVIAAKALKASGLFHRGYVCDLIESNIKNLNEALAAYSNFTILKGDNRNILLPHLPSSGLETYGLLYADPTGYPHSEFEFMKQVSSNPHCHFVDLLLSFGATTVKRISRRYPDTYWRLNDQILSINKVYWFVREPMSDKKQWSFLLATNWKDFPAPKNYFYPIDSPEGQRILTLLDNTTNELNGSSNGNKNEWAQLDLIELTQNI